MRALPSNSRQGTSFPAPFLRYRFAIAKNNHISALAAEGFQRGFQLLPPMAETNSRKRKAPAQSQFFFREAYLKEISFSKGSPISGAHQSINASVTPLPASLTYASGIFFSTSITSCTSISVVRTL